MRSISGEVITQLEEKVIPELLSKLENEIPETGEFEAVSVSFDIPYRITVGSVLIVYAEYRYPMYRRLEVEVNRKDIGVSCNVSSKIGINENIKEYLSNPNVAGFLADKCRYALEGLVEDYDEIYVAGFNKIWNDKNYIEAQFEQRYPLTEEAKLIFFDLKSATTREELYEVLDKAVEQYEECRYIDPVSFQGFGLRIDVSRSIYTQMKDAETGRPIVNSSCEIITLNSGVCAIVQYIG